MLYKKPGSAHATIRVEDTSGDCALDFESYNTDGADGALQSAGVDADSAYTFTAPGKETQDPEGRYFIRVAPECSTTQTYSIEPEPAAQWKARP